MNVFDWILGVKRVWLKEIKFFSVISCFEEVWVNAGENWGGKFGMKWMIGIMSVFRNKKRRYINGDFAFVSIRDKVN